ncbi:type IV secretion protein Rhs [Enterobacter sp. Cy-643]|uniref:type IV secretion protein Rhs n=1 Tax=Enterobacter sp. Cy-643 TaxID=2608346 RepID=UPI00141EBC3D|nr:type IV secretion protein Rhs [Enterobacter sp. Cy-643]NIF31162.1 type IV secretion protein Rhs [Enterobacter sp. Cy-643]
MSKGIKRGGLRLLTLGEIKLARTLYGNAIEYHKVWIHRGSYLPFNMQSNNYAMTPNGEIWFQAGVYESDYSMSHMTMKRIDGQHIFMHEMMHVWQHQRGMWVRTRGAFSWAADYTYDLEKPTLLDYGLEQQACIVSDYWLLKTHGFAGYSHLYNLRHLNPAEPTVSLFSRYKKILGRFPL